MSDTDTDTTARRGGLPEDDALASAFASATKRRRRSSRDEASKEKEQPAEPTPVVQTAKPDPGNASPSESTIPVQPQGHEPAAAAEEPQNAVEPEPAPEQADEQPDPAPEAAAPPAAPAERREVAVAVPASAAPVPVTARPLPELGIKRQGPSEQRSTQCTVNVSVGVRDRFAAYQLAKKLERGSEPTNAVVVRRAVLHARKNDLFDQMLEAIRHRQAPLDDEDDDPEGLFGDVQGRRVERGRARDMAQQSFRPSYEELAVIDAMVRAYGFEDRSKFLDAALDAFLPPLQEKRRRS